MTAQLGQQVLADQGIKDTSGYEVESGWEYVAVYREGKINCKIQIPEDYQRFCNEGFRVNATFYSHETTTKEIIEALDKCLTNNNT